MNNKIINFPQKKSQKNLKMLFLVIVFGALAGMFFWRFFVENVARVDVQIPESKNITFNNSSPISMTTAQVANEFEKSENKPILLYIYTTWCQVCSKNFSVINEISREFQNTELRVITLAIDRNLDGDSLKSYLGQYGEIYFEPRFLAFKDGFIEFLQKQNISYNNRIPFTVLISKDGDVVTKFSGMKSKNYLRNKIIKELYL